jgi:rSAM/selenodomain-associated transferase 1
MAKAPRAGTVKTRLCPPLSPTDTAALYRCFLLDTLEETRSVADVTTAVAYTPADARASFEATCPGIVLVPQRGEDLGARLSSAFEELFGLGFGAVIAIGADTPTLPGAYLRSALHLIENPGVDLVLGPSEDGGYYLIGLRALYRQLFEDIPWSTDRVLAETLRRAKHARLAAACLPMWWDIDTSDDLNRLEAELVGGDGTSGRETRRFLAARAGGLR